MNYEQEAMKTLDIRIHEWKGMPPAGANGYSIGSIDFSLDYIKTRARELGLVNGYKWGEEYPTNGKKPDLPDDCIVSIRIHFDEAIGGNQPVSEWVWGSTVSFKITEQRYKPVEVEQVQADKSAAEVNGYALLDMLDNLSDDEMVWFQQSDEAKSLLKLLTNRKADEEKRKFVEAISGKNLCGYIITDGAAKELYDLGCRFK